MTSTCPAGHRSESNDYCDVCGAPIGAGTAGGPGSGGVGAGVSGAAASGAGASGGGASGSGGAAGQAGSSAPGGLLDLGTPSAPAGRACPNCGAQAMPGALFCEDCGYDFTTGQLPRTDPPPLIPPAGMTAPPPLSVDLAPAGPSAVVPPPVPATGSGPVPATGADPAGTTPAGTTPAGTTPAGTTPAQEGPVDWVAEVWVDPEWHAAQEVTEPCPSPGMPVVVPLRGTTQLIGRRSASRNIHPQIDVGADTGVSRRHAQLTTDGQRWWVEDLQSSNGTFVGTAGGALPDTPVPPGQRTELQDDARVYVGAWTRIVVRSATDDERASAG